MTGRVGPFRLDVMPARRVEGASVLVRVTTTNPSFFGKTIRLALAGITGEALVLAPEAVPRPRRAVAKFIMRGKDAERALPCFRNGKAEVSLRWAR